MQTIDRDVSCRGRGDHCLLACAGREPNQQVQPGSAAADPQRWQHVGKRRQQRRPTDPVSAPRLPQVPIELSGLELKLLRYFVEHRGALLTRDELLEKVWGYDAMPVTRTVDVHVASLRQKLEKNPSRPEHLVTVHGLGYKFMG